jgi:phosphate transport system permease protein
MTDATARAADFRSPGARNRLTKRYRAEARFRSYGIIGLSLTALFIAVLLFDIVSKGLPAFTAHSLAIDVALDPAVLDPDGTRNPGKLARADFSRPTKERLQAYFPDATSRAERKALFGLLSSGAAEDLRRRVLADPSLLGRTLSIHALLSDEADLYLKGTGTAIDTEPGEGAARVTEAEQSYTVSSSAPDFAPALAHAKRYLSQRAAELIEESARLRNRRDALVRQQPSASGAGQADTDRRALDAKIADLETLAAHLKRRASAPSAPERLDATMPSILAAAGGGLIKAEEIAADRITGPALLKPVTTDLAPANSWQLVTYVTPESLRQISDQEIAWLESLKQEGVVDENFNIRFFTSSDSREPELAGIRGALVGSFLTLLVTLVICLPVGVAAAIYLEEFAPKNRITELIEVNINNLAAVPSIVFGLLGLALFLNTFGLPRSAALVGGLVLALLVLPTIIIASRAALKAVPPSIREAALAIGASHQQAVFHHVLPLAMPGIMTGTIIGMAHALGETAPLLLIGMVAFIVDVPGGVTDSATVLPVQIFLWSDLPEPAFEAKTAAAIIVLLVFLFLMNGIAIVLRRHFERRW